MDTTPPHYRGHASPSSPPATPTTASHPNFTSTRNKRQGGLIHNYPRHITPITTSEQPSNIVPNGFGEHTFSFSYNPFSSLDLELSPRSRSSSPAASSTAASEDRLDSPHPRSRSSSPASPFTTSTKERTRTIRSKIVQQGNFTVEEFDEEDWSTYNNEEIIRPSQYEDAESNPARSTKGRSPSREIDPEVLSGMQELHCSPSPLLSDRDEHEAWLVQEKAARRRRRRSSGVSKRSHAQSVGSGTDDEDVQPVFQGVNEAGSSARRLRRKVGEKRGSLIFDDPPPRIDELEEPESCEEVVSFGEGEDGGDGDGLPYWVQEEAMEED